MGIHVDMQRPISQGGLGVTCGYRRRASKAAPMGAAWFEVYMSVSIIPQWKSSDAQLKPNLGVAVSLHSV